MPRCKKANIFYFIYFQVKPLRSFANPVFMDLIEYIIFLNTYYTSFLELSIAHIFLKFLATLKHCAALANRPTKRALLMVDRESGSRTRSSHNLNLLCFDLQQWQICSSTGNSRFCNGNNNRNNKKGTAIKILKQQQQCCNCMHHTLLATRKG